MLPLLMLHGFYSVWNGVGEKNKNKYDREKRVVFIKRADYNVA
jgi:hypothetical protein